MKSKGKVLYLSYDGLTDPLGQSQIMPYIIGLSEKGYDFHIISFEKQQSFDALKSSVQANFAGRNITWIPLKYTKRPPIVSTIFDLWKMNREGKKILQKGIDIIHCRSYLPMLVAQRIRKKEKVIFDMRGLWADERVEGGLWPQNQWIYRSIYRFFIKQEKVFIEDANAIVSLTKNGIQAIEERYKSKINSPTWIIPCCVDTNRFSPNQSGINLPTNLNLPPESNLLIHVGSVGTWYRLDLELAFFNELPPTWYFLILTTDQEKANAVVQQTVSAKDRIIVRSASYHDVPDYLLQANASIIWIEPSFSKRASSPVKLGESLAMGLPVIVNAGIGDMDDLIEKNSLGIIINEKNDIPKAAQEFLRMNCNPTSIRGIAMSELSLEKGISTYEDIYQFCIQS